MNAVQTQSMKFLEQGPATIRELKVHLGCSYEYARKTMHTLPARIKRWALVKGIPVAVYELGAGPDDPKPPKQTEEQRVARARESMRALRARRGGK